MRGFFITIFVLFLIPVFGQTVCIVPDGYSPVIVNGKKTITVCPNTTVTLMSVDCNSYTQIKANWYKDGNSIAPLFNYPTPDPGTYIAQYRSSNGYTYNDTLVIENKNVINLSIYRNGVEKTGDNTCENKPITFTSTIDNELTNYKWYNLTNPNNVLSNTHEVTIENIVLNEGEKTRYIDLTVEADYKGCTVKQTMLLVVFEFPKFSLGPDTGYCSGNTLTLTLPDSIGNNPSLSYQWSTGETENYKIINTPDSYSVKITNNVTKCENSDTIFIEEYPNPVLQVSSDTTICPGATTPLNASVTTGTGTAPYFYQWSPNSTLNTTSQETVTAKPKQPTYYKVLVLDKNFCRDFDSIHVNLHPEVKAMVSFSDTSTCKTPITLLSSGQGGTPFASGSTYQYSWSPLINISGENTATPVITPQDTLLYTVTVTDAKGCSDDTAVSVKTPDMSIVIQEGSSMTVCENESVNLSAKISGGEPGFTFVWDGTGISGTTTNSITTSTLASPGPAANLYSVKAIDNRGCEATDTITITAVSPPEVTVSSSFYQICEGDSIRFDPPSIINGTGSYSVSWSGENLSDAATNQPLFYPETGNGTKTFVITVKDATVNCPEDNDTLKVEIISKPYAELIKTDTLICAGTTINLSPDTIESGLSFEWRMLPDNSVISDSNSLPVANEGTYHLTTVEPVIGCTTKDSIVVAYLQAPSGAQIQADTVAPNNEPFNLNSLVNGQQLEYTWETNASGSFNNSNNGQTIYAPSTNDTGYYTFTIVVKNHCADSISAKHTVRFYEEIIKTANKTPYIPNAFSPYASAQKNQTLLVFSNNIDEKDFLLSVYNRWGELVYETQNVTEATETGWDGLHQKTGKPLTMDVYTYVLKGRYTNGKAFEKSGTVTLIK